MSTTTRTRKRAEPRLRAQDRILVPPSWEKHLVVLPDPCDFVDDVFPILPPEAWERLDKYERGIVARIFVRYGYRARLVLRGLLRGFISVHAIAAAGGVVASTVRKWKSDYDGFREDYEIIAGLAGSLLERKLFAHGLSERSKAQRATEFWLKAAAPETYGKKLTLPLEGETLRDDGGPELELQVLHERGPEREEQLRALHDFERDVLPALLPPEEWECHDEDRRFELMQALAPHGLPQQLALRALVRGVIAPRNVAGAAGVTVATVNRWKRADSAFAWCYELVRLTALIRMEEKLNERALGDGRDAARALLFSLEASYRQEALEAAVEEHRRRRRDREALLTGNLQALSPEARREREARKRREEHQQREIQRIADEYYQRCQEWEERERKRTRPSIEG